MEYEFTTTVEVEEWTEASNDERLWGDAEDRAWGILFDRLYDGHIRTAEDLKRVFRNRVTAATEPPFWRTAR